MKKNVLIVSSLAALMALSTFAQAFEAQSYRHAEFRCERRAPLVAYRYERHWRPEHVVVRSVAPAPVCVVPAPTRYIVEEPRYAVAPLAIGLRLHGLRAGLSL